ncbi:MAG: MBL fold metallo-hydrolase [Bradyrhizobium sp.]
MLRTGLAVVATTLMLAGAAIAQQPPAAPPPPDFSKVEIKTTDLGDNVYMLEGQGGNITVAVGKDAIIMVDGEYAPLHDKIKAAISTVSNLPIKYLVNTHFHGDHTGGNEPFARDGAAVVSEINVKNRLAAGSTNGLTGVKDAAGAGRSTALKNLYRQFSYQAQGPRRRSQAYRECPYRRRHLRLVQELQCAVDRRHLHHRPLSQYRFCQWRQHQGHDRGDHAYLKLVNAKSRIVPGHGPLADRAVLVEYRAMLVTARDRMAKLVKDGKSEDDVVAAKPFADLDAKWAPTELASKNFIRVVYHSLADKKG